MLASRRHTTFVRAKRHVDVPSQFCGSGPNGSTRGLLSMGLALIAAGEHVLATAKDLLRSLPEPDHLVARVPLAPPPDGPIATAVVDERPWVVVESQHLGPVCEAIVENEW
jgi:hypothetical protein